ncbi:MAG: 4-alpha-glucanotransferase [Clostridia bacterium]|nr:4-alpha-glucanotransferase [Clostridia bacterium]
MKHGTRKAGILLPVSALPSPFGIGCFSKEAYRFVDKLAESGQSFWQILPLTPTAFGDSPYQSPSAFAGNPYFLDLEGLVEEGLLSREECENALGASPADRVDYGLQYRARLPLLRLAASRFQGFESKPYLEFLEKNREWLLDYALFMALKDFFGGAPWQAWREDLRRRDPDALKEARESFRNEIEAWCFLQFRFSVEWGRLRDYANGKGIRIIGDLPIYVSADSADVWANRELFLLDEAGNPLRVAGCPPDDFSPDGQLWGNPLYRWEVHRRGDYAWWISRLSAAFSLYDVVRIDHFRGFDSYYSIPAGETTARNGRWEKGIGDELFRVAEEELGHREILAEDLGYMTDSVRALLDRCGFPGMKILQFGFGGSAEDFSSPDLPHHYPAHCVAYTGTHDNATLREWLASASPSEWEKARDYLWMGNTSDEAIARSLIAALMRSPAELCIVPLWDYLSLGAEARMNTPASANGNWQWRVRGELLTDNLFEEIRRFATIGSRRGS